jgi:hypothetical protein
MLISNPCCTHFVNVAIGLELLREEEPNGLPCDALNFSQQQIKLHASWPRMFMIQKGEWYLAKAGFHRHKAG